MSKTLFPLNGKTAIGMVHCLALPGAANFDGNMDKVVTQAIEDARTLERAGADAVIVENMNDLPLPAELNKVEVAALAAVTSLVCHSVSIPVGVDAAFSDGEAAVAVAVSAGAQFVRCPVFVDMVVNFCGTIGPSAQIVMQTKARLHAEDIFVLADIQVKHSRMLLPETSIEESAANAVACGADGIIVTGLTTGMATPMELVTRVKNVVQVPVFVGSGVTAKSIADQLSIADGAIIGTNTKPGGVLSAPVDYDLAHELFSSR